MINREFENIESLRKGMVACSHMIILKIKPFWFVRLQVALKIYD